MPSFTRAQKAGVSFHYDALNLDYSLPFNYGNCLHSNLYAGVGGARIKEHLIYKYSNADGTISRTIKSPSSFLGAGPQLGLDFSYGICNNLHLTGSGSASLLVGTLKNHTSYASFLPA